MIKRVNGQAGPPDDERDGWSRPGLGVVPEPEAERHLEALTTMALRADVGRARALATIDRSRHYRLRGCASTTEYGARMGLRPAVTRDLVQTGYLLGAMPEIELHLLDGSLSFRSAGKLFEVLSEPAADPGPWLTEACRRSTRDFCAQVDEHLVAKRTGQRPVRMTMIVSAQGERLFHRARTLAQRRAGRVLSDGDALESISEDFVERFDPLRKSTKGQPTGAKPKDGPVSRYIPEWVKAIVRKRHGDRCAVPDCPCTVWTQFSHIIEFRNGGEATPENIILLCFMHNQMVENGFLKIRGTVDNLTFLDARGEVVFGPPHPLPATPKVGPEPHESSPSSTQSKGQKKRGKGRRKRDGAAGEEASEPATDDD